MNWKNDFTKKTGFRYPVIQAPMYGVTTPEMVASATSTGCMGSLSLGSLPADKCTEVIRQTKTLTNNHFAVNIFVNKIPPLTQELKTKYARTRQFIQKLAKEHGLEVDLPGIESINLSGYEEQTDAIIAEGCKIVSFTFGNLDEKAIQKLKGAGAVLIGTCTSLWEAQALEKSGIDMICVQGIEAGGHRGSFTEDHIPEIGGFSLLAQVCESVKIPVIYAGGIYNAKTLLAAHRLGAQAFQVGSLLLGSKESALSTFEKGKLQNVNEKEIVLTRSFSGRYARGIKNVFIETLEHSEYVLPYPYQNKLTGPLRKASKDQENLDFVSIWMGQSIHKFSEHSTTAILKDLIRETENSAVNNM